MENNNDGNLLWEYIVTREGDDLLLSWSTEPAFRRIRTHTTKNENPYYENQYGLNDIIRITKGQWCSMLKNNVWMRMSDADNR